MPDLLPSFLTDAQREAITHPGGPLLLVAGPGAGKTAVMVRRTAYLVLERGVDPGHLLLTTFTNRARDELYDRLYRYLGLRAQEIHISTIHSFCQHVLASHPRAHDWGAGFEVLDEQGQFLFVYSRLKDLGLSRFPKGRMGDFISSVVGTFSLLTEEGVDPEAFLAAVRERGADLLALKKPKPEAVEEYEGVAEAYGRYVELLREERVMDFATLQRVTYDLLDDPALLAALRDRYRHLLVDEYQDTNRLQVLILKRIAEPRREICAVGDDDQAIYRFRGATVTNFLRFTEDFPGARRIPLDVNFRSTAPLVEAAADLIARNAPHREEKDLRAHRGGPAAPPVLIHGERCTDEAAAVVRTLAGWHGSGRIRSYDEVALLFRSVKYHAPDYLEALDRHGVPYTVAGDGKFLAREDILQLQHLFTFCGAKHRWNPGFLEGKVLELRPAALEAVWKWEEDPVDWVDDEALDRMGVWDDEARAVLRRLAELRRRTREGEVKDMVRLLYELLERTGYMERCCREGPCEGRDDEAETALLNLGQFSELLAGFQRHVRTTGTWRLADYLRKLPDRMLDERRPEPREEAVRVMTVHQAKGLEFPVVVVGSAMEGRFPGRFRRPKYPVPADLRLSGEEDSREQDERDQRRLFYVAMTRAEDLLVIGTADKVNKRGGGPSRFVEEIGSERFVGPESPKPVPGRGSRKRRSRPRRERISYSALHSYLLCPLQYKLRHECGFEVPSYDMSHFGTAIHRAMELLHERGRKGERVDAVVAEALWKEIWKPPRSWPEKEAKGKEKLGLRYLRRYMEHFGDRFQRVRWVEEPMELPVDLDGPDGDGLVVSGRLDLACEAEDGLEVIDFKVRSRKGLETIQPRLQVETYGLALARVRGEEVSRVVLHLLAEKDPARASVAYAWSGGREGEAEGRLHRAAEGILAEVYEPTPGPHCALCDFVAVCPAAERPEQVPAGRQGAEAEEEEAGALPLGATP